MWVADNWTDYEVIDASDGEKLERWGDYVLLRPDPQVIWHTAKAAPQWKKLNAHYHRSSKGGGEWEFFDLPKEWEISYAIGGRGDILRFRLQPFSFKHTGLFPEQAANWNWFSSIIKEALAAEPSRTIKVLNLFAYTGGATLAAAAAGAHVTHVDASKGMVTWAKENAHITGLPETSVRWLVDDCRKFVEREIRRGNHYDAIIMDPPSYGRGPKGEIWKLEDALYDFVTACEKLLVKEPLFFLINSYTTGLQAGVIGYMLSSLIEKKHGGTVAAEEIGLPVTASGLILPCGCSGRFTGKPNRPV
ncbi:MAG: class I SAM-dependent methyltransferase [Lachnospiraceae bacterium]|nr:class I SAM-dependent methyltransferase [Lachnospiraceae bacterium]